METLEFNLVRAEQPVRMKTRLADGSDVVLDYVLCETDGGGRERYMDDLVGRIGAQDSAGNVTTVKSFSGMHAALLVGCLFEVLEAGPPRKLRPVSYEEIQAYPAQAQTALYEAAVALGGLNKGAKEDAKKA